MKKLILSLLLLTGCGWSPLYSEQINPSTQTAQIFVSPIPNQYGAKMRRILQNAFPMTKETTSQYRLIVQPPSFSSGDKTISNDEFASMMQVTATTDYYLENNQTHQIITSHSINAVSSYAVVKNPYATTVAKNHIQEELSEQLAQQIALDVLAKISEESE